MVGKMTPLHDTFDDVYDDMYSLCSSGNTFDDVYDDMYSSKIDYDNLTPEQIAKAEKLAKEIGKESMAKHGGGQGQGVGVQGHGGGANDGEVYYDEEQAIDRPTTNPADSSNSWRNERKGINALNLEAANP